MIIHSSSCHTIGIIITAAIVFFLFPLRIDTERPRHCGGVFPSRVTEILIRSSSIVYTTYLFAVCTLYLQTTCKALTSIFSKPLCAHVELQFRTASVTSLDSLACPADELGSRVIGSSHVLRRKQLKPRNESRLGACLELQIC